MGLPASGKTTLAEALARRLDLVHLSSDMVRKELAGLRPTERAGGVARQQLYSAAMTRRTYTTLRRRAVRWLRRGRSVVIDATFGQAAERAGMHRLAARTGARLVVLLCRVDDATVRGRLAARADDTTVVSDARLDHWPDLRAAFTEPVELPDVLTIDTSASLDAAVEQALAGLEARGVRPSPTSPLSQ